MQSISFKPQLARVVLAVTLLFASLLTKCYSQSVSGIGYMDGSNTLGIWSTSSTASEPVISVTPQQAVGIGVVTPPTGYKLAVNGSAIFTKIKVQAPGWADYVFYPTYKLPSLSYVKSFIEKYHHLPGVPSTREVEKNGIDLAETQVTLLKKIEELTLYVIEQNMKLEDQARKIELLEAKQIKK